MKKIGRMDICFLFMICLALAAAGQYARHADKTDTLPPAPAVMVSSGSESGPDAAPPPLPGPDQGSGTGSPLAAPSPTPAPSAYTVKSGDTLWDIAAACNTTVAQLQALNHLDGDALSPGQTLLVGGLTDQGVKVAVQSPPAPAPSRAPQRARTGLLQYAARFLQTPYRYGGSTPSGFDCSGYVQYVYKHFGVSLPRTAAAQAGTGTRVARADLLPGDLVFFNTGGGGIDHVGIYAGNGRFIHSSSPASGGVIYTSLDENYYARSYAGARRLTY